MKPPEAAPIEKEIFDFFADRNFERSRRFAPAAYDPQLVRDFLRGIGNPQLYYKSIHIAGTVGKGSVTTYLARALTALGFKTGAYLSPHFTSLSERFTIAGLPIAADTLATLWHELKTQPKIATLSFFDAMTALGFLFFERSRCDWAVIEVGLGGRLDSTNNLAAEIAVITRIALDHRTILGNTTAEIAGEKAGIIHKGQRVYTPPQEAEVFAVLQHTAKEAGAELISLEPQGDTFVEQNRDFAAQIVADAFHPTGEALTRAEQALAEPLFGRWTCLSNHPRIIFDGGHNTAAMAALCPIVNRQPEGECNIFLNTMMERDLAEFARMLRSGIQKKISLFLFSMDNPLYHGEPPEGSGIEKVNDAQIRERIQAPDTLQLFTGSMSIYAELRTRFGL
jgi:dihydrofolate synthase/folylpolyglutamate synthase